MVRILLVGCGKMGGALLRGWGSDPAYEIAVIEKAAPPAACRFQWVDSLSKIETSFTPDVVVFAIKPQMMAEVAPAFGVYKDALFLSIAAGIGLGRLKALLRGDEPALLRAMPNLPASIGSGATVCIANSVVTAAQKDLASALLQTIGTVDWVDREELIDAVTALSGSGPAYFFALTEAMALAGEKLGLSGALARALARQTLIGSGALLRSGDASASELRIAVTSPGGTTAAALKELMAERTGLFPLIERVMEAACVRSKELGG